MVVSTSDFGVLSQSIISLMLLHVYDVVHTKFDSGRQRMSRNIRGVTAGRTHTDWQLSRVAAMISASVGVNSSLLLEPAQTLAFALDRHALGSPRAAKQTGQVNSCLSLNNISTHKHVIFKIRTTRVDMFLVKPAQGVIEPGGVVTVVVTLVSASCQQLLAMTAAERDAVIERFLIQSIDCSDDMRGYNVDDLSAFWKRIPKELITNKKLTCRFVEAQELDAVHLPLHRMRLQSDASQELRRLNRVESPMIDKKSFHRQRIPGEQQKQPQRQTMPSFAPLRSQITGSYKSPSLPKSPVGADANGYAQRSNSYSNSSSNNEDRTEHDLPASMFVSSMSPEIDSYDSSYRNEDSYNELIASSDVREYRIHPNDSLTFAVRRKESGGVEGTSYFLLTNRSRYSGLAFKVKTSNFSGYFVKPARGTIGPTNAQRVDVIVNAPDATAFQAREREVNDRFLIEVLFLDMGTYSKVATYGDDRQRKELQRLWGESDAIDREKSVLTCQIVEEDEAIDPTQQTAEQARARLQKTQAMVQSFNAAGARMRGDVAANSYVHPPPQPAAMAYYMRPETVYSNASIDHAPDYHPYQYDQQRDRSDSDTDTFYA